LRNEGRKVDIGRFHVKWSDGLRSTISDFVQIWYVGFQHDQRKFRKFLAHNLQCLISNSPFSGGCQNVAATSLNFFPFLQGSNSMNKCAKALKLYRIV